MHTPFTIHPFLLAAALFASMTGCNGDEGAAETSIEEVRDWPNAYYGKVITAVGEVEEKYASGAFRLDGQGTWWNDDILVVVPREQALALEHGTEVRITGEVMRLTVTEVEREYDLDLETELETEFRDKPILMARNIAIVEPD